MYRVRARLFATPNAFYQKFTPQTALLINDYARRPLNATLSRTHSPNRRKNWFETPLLSTTTLVYHSPYLDHPSMALYVANPYLDPPLATPTARPCARSRLVVRLFATDSMTLYRPHLHFFASQVRRYGAAADWSGSCPLATPRVRPRVVRVRGKVRGTVRGTLGVRLMAKTR